MINIYKASAGSGKTFTLAKEYLKLILGHKDENGNYVLSKHRRNTHRHVLAITFTNKATEEMKSRIIHELAVIAGCERGWDKPSDYEADLCKTFSCTPSELNARANDALRDLLYDFNSFSVSTIDSFFQLILRAFAKEAEVSGNYDVELDDKAVTAMGIDQLFQDLNHGAETEKSKYLLRWLSSYMTSMIEDGKSFNIFNRSNQTHQGLIDFISHITDDTFRANENEIIEYLSDISKFEKFKDAVYLKIKETKRMTAAACKKAYTAVTENGLSEIVKGGLINALKQWSTNGYSPTSGKGLQADIAHACENIESAYYAKHKNSPLRTELIDGIIANAVLRCAECFNGIRELNIISDNLYKLGMFSSIIEYINKYRRENATILLSDTNTLLAHIIAGDDTPFLYERVGQRYQHYLIDEFQDTSSTQWQNLKPLVRESLSYDNDNLVIGDEKQCIYRFRDSDPSLLHNLHHETHIADDAKESGNTIAENTNWRSSVNVIRFNNTLFSALAKNLGVQDIYSNVVQQISSKNADRNGYVKVGIFNAQECDTEQMAMAQLTTELRRQLESGYRPGEIAILVRKWSEGEKIVRHLEAERLNDPSFPKFQIVSDNSFRISRSPIVSIIISRMRLLCSSDYKSGYQKKSQKEIAEIMNRYEMAHSQGKTSAEAINIALKSQIETTRDDETLNDTPTGDNDSSSANVDLITLVEEIIKRQVPPESLEHDNLYITAFMDLVAEFVSHGKGDVRSFLNWWDDSGCKTNVTGASDDSALNILSIHKSKGLEFRCVHIPFAEMSESNQGDISWFPISGINGIDNDIIPPMLPLTVSKAMEGTMFEKQYVENVSQKELDRLNLLYVAFTRSIDELCIGLKVGGRGRDFSKEIHDALKDCSSEFISTLYDTHKITADIINPFTPITINEDGIATIGTPTTKNDGCKKKTTAMEPADQIPMPAYFIRQRASIWDNTKLDKFIDIDIARERGVLLHDIMAHVYHAHDVNTAINSLIIGDRNGLTETDIQQLRYIITQRVNNPAAEKWFDDFEKVLIERPILVGEGTTLRPDRVVWTKDGEIHIIDYKSGSQPHDRYKRQLDEYIAFYQSISDRTVKGFIYYLDSGKIVHI